MPASAATRATGASGRGGQRGAQRSAARLAAVQALYQVAMTGAPAEKVLAEFLEHRMAEDLDGLRLAVPDRRLLADLVTGVAAEAEELDDMLAAVLDENWPVERLETLLRVVLRAGAYEVAGRRDVPARVVISEYVDLADAFFGGKEPGLVNGVLDRLARSLRPEEFEAEGPAPGPSA